MQTRLTSNQRIKVNLAPRVSHLRPRKRRQQRSSATGFFPGEVVRILRLDGIDYRQLREMLRLARELRGERLQDSRWARYTFADLCAIRVIVELFGGPSELRRGARLQLRRLRSICLGLRKKGVADPLLQVKLTRLGRSIVAQTNGVKFEAATGQLLLDSVYREAQAASEQKPTSSRRELKRERGDVTRRVREGFTARAYFVDLEGGRR
jgi:hypothetical protein